MEPTIDVVGVGNAIVDVLASVDDSFILEHGLTKGSMTLIDAERAAVLHAAMPPGIVASGGSLLAVIVGAAVAGGAGGALGAGGGGRGAAVDAPIHLADWYATFCALAGVDPIDPVEGGLVPDIDSFDYSGVLKAAGGAPTDLAQTLTTMEGVDLEMLIDHEMLEELQDLKARREAREAQINEMVRAAAARAVPRPTCRRGGSRGTGTGAPPLRSATARTGTPWPRRSERGAP